MRLFRISNILTLAVAAMFGVLLFWTSEAVQKKERELSKSKAELSQEQETVRVLSVEWDYLNRPQRLEQLAKELGMQLPSAQEVVSGMDQIPEPIEPAAGEPSHPKAEEAITHSVSLDNAPYSSKQHAQPASPRQVPKKAEILSPSSAEKQSFERLIQSLDEEGGQ